MSNDRYKLDQTFTFSTSTHGFEIRWTRIGDPSNPNLVFIHGTPWSSAVWHDLAFALESRYCIFLYDHPGFGLSPQISNRDGTEPDLDSSLALRAEASAALFRHWNFGTQPVHVVAHDNGGLVSLRLFLQHAVKYASLCLVDVVALSRAEWSIPFFDLVGENPGVFRALPNNFVEGLTRSYIKSAAFRPLDPQIEDLLTGQWLEDGSQGPERFLQEILQAHSRDIGEIETQYAEVGREVPVKIIWGRDDKWLPSEIAQRLSTALNARETVLIKDAGHLIHYDQPSALAVEVTIWLIGQS